MTDTIAFLIAMPVLLLAVVAWCAWSTDHAEGAGEFEDDDFGRGGP